MKNCLFGFLAFITSILHAAPDSFRLTDTGLIYQVKIEFASAEDAAAAKLEFLPLPAGRKVAFSTRWDDCNPRHSRMAELLTEYGFRGTFYLTSPNPAFCRDVLPRLIMNGHSIGNHTLDHRDLTALVPDEIGRQILQNRIELESKSNQEINAFVLPYCRFWRSENPEASRWIGQALHRSGILGSPEYYQDLRKKYKLNANRWFGSMLFTVNDRTPDAARFEREVEKRLALLNEHPFIHMTLGMHTWQNTKGFATLARCFEKYGNRPEWWYCNENEYLAYRFRSLNTVVEKKQVDGTTAVFTLKQAYPASPGAHAPLWAKVTPANRRGETLIPLNTPDLSPLKIDALFFSDNTIASSTKFPEISAGLDFHEGRQELKFTIMNNSRETLSELMAIGRLPFRFDETAPIRLPALPPGERFETTILLSPASNQPETVNNTLFFAFELNFIQSGKAQRLWICRTHSPSITKETVPRDHITICGPFKAGTFDPFCAQWKPMNNPPTLLPAFVKIPRQTGKECALRLTVKATHSADYPLHINRRNLKALYFNGRKLPLPAPRALSLKPGVSTLIAVLAADGEEAVFALSSSKDLSLLLPCMPDEH